MKIRQTSNKRQTSKRKISKSLVTGSIIAAIIAATPYLFYIYESFPDEKIWKTFLFTYEANYYEMVNVSVWTIMSKFVPLLLLVIWFFTCKHWWYHVLLIPMGMYFFQLVTVLNDDLSFTDETEFWYVFIIMVIIVPFIYLIRTKIFTNVHYSDLEDVEREMLENKGFVQQIKDLFK
ncbi:hypothetical protein [Mesonia sp. K7]|uniref:hypothetical protein n=1 Tax=Mesonia sp. K7 TaxID=2218606 RepID=UPI000DA8B589|nr:hypothetical protein [Mesonia sp. K7]PZD78199.1 hypothetical protein DNG35_05720 [Mesonia sp. K7]